LLLNINICIFSRGQIPSLMALVLDFVISARPLYEHQLRVYCVDEELEGHEVATYLLNKVFLIE